MALGAALLVAAILSGYLGTGFVLDDAFHVRRAERPLLHGALDYAIRTDEHGIVLWLHREPVRFEFLRPLSALSMWLDRRVWGTRAWGFHLTNLALHALAVFLLVRLACSVGLAPRRAALAAIAWGVGIPAAAGGWISGRTDVLAAVCALAGVLALLRWQRGGARGWFAIAIVAGAAAGLCKESGLVAPALAVLVARTLGAPESRLRAVGARHAAMLALPAVVIAVTRFGLMRLPLPSLPYLDVPHDVSSALWILAKPIGYLGCALLSIPVLRVAPYGELHSWPWLVLPLALLVAVLALPLVRAAGRGAALAWLGWFGLAIVPVLPVISTSLYAYLPSMGVALLIATAWQRTERRVFECWLLALAVAGVGAHVAILAGVAPWPAAFRRALPEIARLIGERRPERLIVLDAPVWSYALPAELRVQGGASPPATWFVNFSPRVWPATGSDVRWVDSLAFEMRAPEGRYLASAPERFLAFGGTPATRSDTGAVRVRALDATATPGALEVRFQDRSARDASLIVQFDRGQVRVVVPPALQAARPTRPSARSRIATASVPAAGAAGDQARAARARFNANPRVSRSNRRRAASRSATASAATTPEISAASTPLR